jgi:hypothetical protein
VVPLTASTGAASDALLGAAAARPTPVTVDPVATRVLTKGEPIAGPAGQADDFGWPRSNGIAIEPAGPTPAVAAPQRPRASQTAATPAQTPPAAATPPAAPNGDPAQQPKRRPRTADDNAPRPPLGINPFNPFARGGAH